MQRPDEADLQIEGDRTPGEERLAQVTPEHPAYEAEVLHVERPVQARAVDIPIITHGDDQVFYNGAMGSEMVQVLLVDCLVLGIAHFRQEAVTQNLVRTRKVVEETLRV